MESVETLQEIGLTRNESIIYLTLLQTGQTRTGPLLSAAKLNSGRIYETLDMLKSKGLVSESLIDGVRQFTAAPPGQLREWIAYRKQDLQEDEARLEAILPTLANLRKATSSEVKTSTYFGIRGLRAALADASDGLQEGEEIIAMGLTSRKDERYNNLLRTWTERIGRRNIRFRYLFTVRGEHYRMTKRIGKPDAIRVLEGITPAAIDVFGDRTIMLFNYEEESFIVIHSPATARSVRTFFEQLWASARP